MKVSLKKAIIAIVIANLILIAGAICGKILGRFDYSEHLDDTVIAVDEGNITLREFGYYIFEVEAFVQKQALLYDPDNPKHWWNTHFSAGMDSQFVCDYARKVAVNSCIADEIYYREAISKGFTLRDDEEKSAADKAQETIGSMDPVQMSSTGLNDTIILETCRKQALASKYARSLAEDEGVSTDPDEAYRLVNWDGDYYLEEVLPGHVTWTNDDLLKNIVFGKITVNLQ
jgi:hypothetical protein